MAHNWREADDSFMMRIWVRETSVRRKVSELEAADVVLNVFLEMQ